jgi:hypothetical protein
LTTPEALLKAGAVSHRLWRRSKQWIIKVEVGGPRGSQAHGVRALVTITALIPAEERIYHPGIHAGRPDSVRGAGAAAEVVGAGSSSRR